MSTKDFIEKDYYAALGVSKNAGSLEIKRAYRKLARQLHPDKNPGDREAEARFKEVSEAYDVLSDDKRRREYDEARSLFGAGGFTPGSGFNAGNSGVPPFDFNDLFNNQNGSPNAGGLGDLFGGLFGSRASGRGGQGTRPTAGPTSGAPRPPEASPVKGQDVETDATLDFTEAITGVTLPLRLSSPGTCRTCTGAGARPGTAPRQCPSCNGTGLITRSQGAFAFSEPCRQCRGVGSTIDDPCPTCQGSGITTEARVITIRVPSGVKDGQRIRISGKGAPGSRGGVPGDLLVTVRVRPHRLFGREGDDLTLDLPVSFPEAVLGAAIRIPTIDGVVTLKIPAGTANGRSLRVRGRGVHRKDGSRGDLLVTVSVMVPENVTAEAQAALATFAQAMPGDPRPHITAAAGGGSA